MKSPSSAAVTPPKAGVCFTDSSDDDSSDFPLGIQRWPEFCIRVKLRSKNRVRDLLHLLRLFAKLARLFPKLLTRFHVEARDAYQVVIPPSRMPTRLQTAVSMCPNAYLADCRPRQRHGSTIFLFCSEANGASGGPPQFARAQEGPAALQLVASSIRRKRNPKELRS
jgi:hypothetical protein